MVNHSAATETSGSHTTESKPPEPREPLAYRAARNGVWVALGSYWVIAFGFVANILLIRLLTPAIYGEFALAMFFYTLFDLQSKVGLSFAFAQHRRVDGETVGTLFAVSLVLGAGTLLLALLAAPVLLLIGYSSSVAITTIILCGVSFIASWMAAFGILLETDLHYKPLSIATVVAVPTSYVPAFGLAYLGLGQYSLISQSVLYSIIMITATLLYVLYARRHWLRLKLRYQGALAWQYLRFGLTTGMSNFASSMLVNADNFILGTIAGTTTLGYYDRAYRVAQWPSLLLNAVVGRAALFTYSQLQDDAARLQRSVTMVLWLSLNVAIPIALALFISAPDLVRLLFGEVWLPAVPLLRILLVGAVVRSLWENAWSVLVGTGQPRRALELSLLQLGFLVIVGVVLTYTFSAAGTAVASVLMFLSGLIAARFSLKDRLPLDWRSILTGPLAALVLTLGSYMLLVRLIGVIEPLWVSVAWKVIWAIGGFMLFSLLVQPKLFTERVAHTWRLVRGRPRTA